MKEKKNIIIVILLITIILLTIYIIKPNDNSKLLKTLPKPEVTEGQRGSLGIDKNINEETIDLYLNRSDSVYRDMRMLKDPGNYESIGGDSYLSGFVKGFEVVPYPYLVSNASSNLPESVGKTYEGKTLFKYNEDGSYSPNYKESMDIMEYLFPKDKKIFLMCGGGGYAGATKSLLVSLGWDENNIYDVGGYWNYNGSNNIKVKRISNGKTYYDFWKVNYHNIDFDNLEKINE